MNVQGWFEWLSVLWGLYLGVELLGQTVFLCLTFGISSSHVSTPIPHQKILLWAWGSWNVWNRPKSRVRIKERLGTYAPSSSFISPVTLVMWGSFKFGEKRSKVYPLTWNRRTFRLEETIEMFPVWWIFKLSLAGFSQASWGGPPITHPPLNHAGFCFFL